MCTRVDVYVYMCMGMRSISLYVCVFMRLHGIMVRLHVVIIVSERPFIAFPSALCGCWLIKRT